MLLALKLKNTLKDKSFNVDFNIVISDDDFGFIFLLKKKLLHMQFFVISFALSVY